MSYNGTEIVELFDGKEWSMKTLAYAYLICKSFNYDEAKYIRKIEGSIDGGMTWKTRYGCELQLLDIEVCKSMQWRVKEQYAET